MQDLIENLFSVNNEFKEKKLISLCFFYYSIINYYTLNLKNF